MPSSLYAYGNTSLDESMSRQLPMRPGGNGQENRSISSNSYNAGAKAPRRIPYGTGTGPSNTLLVSCDKS